MANTFLFPSIAWTGNGCEKLPRAVAHIEMYGPIQATYSQKNKRMDAKLNVETVFAITNLAKIYSDEVQNISVGQNRQRFIIDYVNEEEDIIIEIKKADNKRVLRGIIANLVDGDINPTGSVKIRAENLYDPSRMAALILLAYRQNEIDEEFKNSFAIIKDTDFQKEFLEKNELDALTICCDNLYQTTVYQDGGITASIFLETLLFGEITSGKLDYNNYIGKLHIINGDNKDEKQILGSNLYKKYDVQINIPQEDLKLVPVIDDTYIVPKSLTNIAVSINKGGSKNILLRGPAGTGKTRMAQALACALNMPYMFFTCSSNTEAQDLLGQFVPVTDKKEKIDIAFEDIWFEPEKTYQKITGISSSDVTPEDCFHAFLDFQKKESTKYVFVESPLIKAMRMGYLIEIQEPSALKDAGALTGLNGLLDDVSGSVMLTSGERVYRNPNTVVIFTTNVGYEGTRAMNQSVLSRFPLKYEVKAPSKEVLKERLMAEISVDEGICNEVLTIAEKMNNFAKEIGIEEGVGYREIKECLKQESIIGDLNEAIRITLLPSLTEDCEEQDKIEAAVLQVF